MKSAFWKHLTLVLILALGVRLGAVAAWQSRCGDRFFFGDSESYWSLGRAIAFGQPYEFGELNAQVFRTPGYPLLLAPIFWAAGNEPALLWGRLESAVLGTLSVAGVWCLARQLFDDRTAVIAGLIAAVYPGAVAVSVLVLSEAPFCPFMVGQIILWTAAWRADSRSRAGGLALATGIVAGVATLIRPSWLLFTPFALAIAVAACRERKRHATLGAVMLAGFVLVMMPWWVRNARVTGRFVPTTLQVGASLYDGLNPAATGASDMTFVSRFEEPLRRRPPEPTADEPREVSLDRELRRAAIDWTLAHPATAARLAGVKVLRTWNVWPNERALSWWPIRLAVLCSYVPVLVLGIVGAARTIRRGWPYMLCWLPAVYFTLLHAVFVGSIRYRQPAMLGLIVLAAGVLGAWVNSGSGVTVHGDCPNFRGGAPCAAWSRENGTVPFGAERPDSQGGLDPSSSSS